MIYSRDANEIPYLTTVRRRKVAEKLMANLWITHKYCEKCGHIYSINCFRKDCNSPDKHVEVCLECRTPSRK